MGEESGPLSRLCTRCGVAVAAGYLKCPRCHADQPLPRSRRHNTEGGGTAMSGESNRTVLLAAAAAVAIVALTAWLLLRDPGGSTAAPVAADAAVDDDGTTEVPPDDDSALPDRPTFTPTQGGSQAPASERATTITELSRALRAERLWASVSAAGDTVVIDSSFCEDPGLVSIVDAHAGDLRGARYTGIRCRAPHGGVVFERGL